MQQQRLFGLAAFEGWIDADSWSVRSADSQSVSMDRIWAPSYTEFIPSGLFPGYVENCGPNFRLDTFSASGYLILRPAEGRFDTE